MYKAVNGKIDIIGLINYILKIYPQTKTVKFGKLEEIEYRVNKFDLDVINEVIVDDCYKIRNLKLTPKNIIDIGAFIGDSTILMASKFNNANIFAFEPEKDNFELLKKNVANYKNVKIFPYAVSKIEHADLSLDKRNSGGHVLIHTNGTAKSNIETIEFASIFKENNLKSCDILKIDCEGGEYDIFLNKENHKYIKDIKVILMEYHIFDGSKSYLLKARKLENTLKELGFKVHTRTSKNILGQINKDTRMLEAINIFTS